MARRTDTKGEVDRVKNDLEIKLVDGSYSANSRLPSERELVKKYEVARNTIREAIQRLIAMGWLQSKPGSGIYVISQSRPAKLSLWEEFIANNPASEDMFEFRRVLEGATAYFAAQRAEEDDIKNIKDWLSKLKKLTAANKTDEEKDTESEADVEFHRAIAIASHNTVFVHLQQVSINSMLHAHIVDNCKSLHKISSEISEQLFLQHQVICKAICAKQPDEARTAMHTHIDFARNYIKEHKLEQD